MELFLQSVSRPSFSLISPQHRAHRAALSASSAVYCENIPSKSLLGFISPGSPECAVLQAEHKSSVWRPVENTATRRDNLAPDSDTPLSPTLMLHFGNCCRHAICAHLAPTPTIKTQKSLGVRQGVLFGVHV